MRPACVSSPKSAKICELPKVFLAKRRNICVSPTLAVLDAAVGHIGPIGHIGRRLTPLCTAPFHRPAGALLHLLNLLPGVCVARARQRPFPKAWRAKPAMPRQALRAGRAPCAHARPAPCVVFLSRGRFGPLGLHGVLCVLCVLCDKSTLAVLLRASSWSFVSFVSAPQGKPSTLSQRLHPSRACRALRSLFSVHCSLGRRCRPSRSPGRFSAHRRPLCYTMM